MNQDKISIVIPIKEDSRNLEELLANLVYFGFDDLHVVDSVSLNKNLEISSKAKAKYSVFEWDGKFPKKRNWYLEKNTLREWVLFMDSDERLTNDFCDEVARLIEDDYDAFYVKYNNTFLGKRLRFGDVMAKMPLIRNHIRFEKIEEKGWSTFDMEIHEHPVVKGSKVGIIKARIDHLERTSIEKYLAKHNHYSNWESRRLANQQVLTDVRIRTRLKYLILASPLVSVVYFFYAFVIRFGFLDGLPGYYIARLKAQYFMWIRLKYNYETRVK